MSARDDASVWLSRFNVQWNPTGDIFDVRPDLVRLSLEELADSVLSMRQQLSRMGDELARAHLSRFERQYSFALFQCANAAGASTVVMNGITYRLVLTESVDVYLLPTPPPK